MSDYDKQYEEDLERAQALSLESLALEQFKNKRLQEINKAATSISKSKNTTVSRASSMKESESAQIKYERQQSKSRPRPGVSWGSPATSLIAPPPSSQRKSSSASSITDSPDLISFASPPPTTSITSDIIDLCNKQSYATNQMVTVQQQPYVKQWQQMPVFPSSIMQQQNTGFQFPQNNLNGNLYQSNILRSPIQTPNIQNQLGNIPPIPMYRSSPTSFTSPSQPPPPILPPKNQQRAPPPIPISSSSTEISKILRKKPIDNASQNLIDLAPTIDDKNSVRVSILQEFDPILAEPVYNCTLRTISPECPDDASSVCGSYYDSYDPYDIYTGSGCNSVNDPVYATIVKTESLQNSPAPVVPPRSRMSTIDRRLSKGSKTKLLDVIKRNDSHCLSQTKDSDLRAFYKMVCNVRSQYRYKDPDTNMGLIVSPMVKYRGNSGLSIKLCVHLDFEGANFKEPISFTCDVTTSVEHVTLQLTCETDAPSKDKYTLKVWGKNEYLVPTTLLSDYEYIHNCIKLDEDVVLILLPDSKVDKSFARTLQDDNRDKDITFDDVISNDLVSNNITYDKLKILLETVESEIKKLENAAIQIEQSKDPSIMPPLQPSKVEQSIKCVIKLMGNLYTYDLIQAVEALRNCGNGFFMNHNKTFSEIIIAHCDKVIMALQNLIEMYCKAYTVDFETIIPSPTEPSKNIAEISDSVMIRVCGIYRPPNDWKYDSYTVVSQVYHGMRPIGSPVQTKVVEKAPNDRWPSRIIIDDWCNHIDVYINALARESRLVLVIQGITKTPPEGNNEDNPQTTLEKKEEIGWAAIQFFNYDGELAQGSILLSIWPKESELENVYGPAPSAGTYPNPDHAMLGIEIVSPENTQFPPVSYELLSDVEQGDFNSLHIETQQVLLEICEKDMLYKVPPDVREELWEKRHYLYKIPEALPKVLLAAHSWSYSSLLDLHGMLYAWEALNPIQALQLLLPAFPDMEVRKRAVGWIKQLSRDEVVDYLPQFVVALRYETYENSALAQFLLDCSLRSPRFAHHLFWLLSHNLPGPLPQNCTTDFTERDDVTVNEGRHHRRIKLLLRALLAICGESLRNCFLSQQLLVKNLNDIADEVKRTKESQRLKVLRYGLQQVHNSLGDNPTSLPLSPTLRVTGIEVLTSSYFSSNTLPLQINFMMKDSSVIPAIYKVGDDLQQDMLTLQMVRLMDKLWLKEGLDLKMVAFTCVPTSKKKGMIEMVTKAETLRKIQVEHGLTGSFKDKPISEWLAKHNPSELEYGRAVQNFTASCAGYCVVTYILGICDRHNDNIMLKTSGHLFHIDFGKFLGDAQMFGNFKRDRAPFVLTSDMAYVINGGDRPTEKFHHFVDLCCQAFNIIRNNMNLFLYLFTLMSSSGICGVTPEAASYLHRALLPGVSNPEAASYFAKLIQSALKSWFTQFNFFLHNIAQLKFSSDDNKGSLMSFVPKTYSMKTDGRLTEVKVIGYKKLYDPDKYYVYILQVEREGQREPMDILRTYKEFCELHQKLCEFFPYSKLYSLSTGLHMGRSNIKQVAQKRFSEISLFIQSLFQLAPEICHSDLVYTFFHPLLRDQQYPDESLNKLKDRTISDRGTRRIKGQLKLSLQYTKGVFGVMVHHVRGLPKLHNGQEPSTYVKVYLHPDNTKSTKRKTKVVKKNSHPSFMEMLEYRMPLDIVRGRILKATVWCYDPLQENEFMGGVELPLGNLDLMKETSEWYSLENLTR